MACHPNVGAALLVVSGCEGHQVDGVADLAQNCVCGDIETGRFDRLVMQEQGGLGNTIEAGIAAVDRLMPRVNTARRSVQPLSCLMLALQCGASDGWSGITANPLVGRLSDAVVCAGGTVVLSETPEIFGAVHLLARRASSSEIGGQILGLIARLGRAG